MVCKGEQRGGGETHTHALREERGRGMEPRVTWPVPGWAHPPGPSQVEYAWRAVLFKPSQLRSRPSNCVLTIKLLRIVSMVGSTLSNLVITHVRY